MLVSLPAPPPPTHTHTHTFLQEKGEGEVGKWLFKVRLLQNITSSSHMQGELVQKTLNEMEHSIKRIASGYKLCTCKGTSYFTSL